VKSISDSFRYTLCDAEGEPVDAERITTNVEEIHLDVPIQRIRDVRLVVDVVYGGGATAENTTITVEPASLRLSGGDAVLEEIGDTLTVATLNLANIDKSQDQTFTLNLPEGVTNQTGVSEVKISVKSSSVEKTVAAYEILSQKVDYPLHVGVTEAGTLLKGSVKSALGIGLLLAQGIGDTIRVSLTGDPVNEVIVAKEILKNLGLREEGIEIVSCPTCGRTKVDLEKMVSAVEHELQGFVPKRPLTVAVMGCEVNGPGEAKEADYGIANGKGQGLLFKEGNVIGKYKEEEIVGVLVEEIRRNEQ